MKKTGLLVKLGLFVNLGFLVHNGAVTRLLARALAALLGFEDVADVMPIVRDAMYVLSATYWLDVFAILVGVTAISVVRAVARWRLARVGADPLERVRGFLARHPHVASLVSLLPGLAWSAVIVDHNWYSIARAGLAELPQIAVPLGLALAFNTYLVRQGLRALLAPTAERFVENVVGTELDAEGFTFDAVAITAHTVGAVAAMSALTVAAMSIVMSTRMLSLLHDATAAYLLAAYITVALGGAYLFARKSKISVGLDGVLVGGTTKRRFVAYRDVDHVRVLGDIIELRTRTSALLRLQLHGEDAGRRVAIVERLEAAIARVRAHRADPAAAFVEAASVDELTRAADGAASYRHAAPSRDKLWEIFESPLLAPEARRAAAEALVPGIDATERVRFRVAAEQIAEPTTRVHLHELLEEEAEEPTAEPARALRLPA